MWKAKGRESLTSGVRELLELRSKVFRPTLIPCYKTPSLVTNENCIEQLVQTRVSVRLKGSIHNLGCDDTVTGKEKYFTTLGLSNLFDTHEQSSTQTN